MARARVSRKATERAWHRLREVNPLLLVALAVAVGWYVPRMLVLRETRSASSIVSAETCERSTSMPNRFISLTTSSPKVDSP